MKNILILVFALLPLFSLAQINGNRNIVTKTFPLEPITELEINLSADIIIDTKAASGITITTDENIIDYIDRSVKNGKLDLTQLEWIESSAGHKITIGAPKLSKLISDAHSDTYLKGLDQEKLQLVVNVGKVIVDGQVEKLKAKIKTGTVDALNFKAKEADIKITSWGNMAIAEVENLKTDIDEDASFKILQTPKSLAGDAEKSILKKERTIDKNVRYIDFKIKNNSRSRNNFYVIGPKQDGSRFSYGFSMSPGQSRKERWTTGTKVYKVNMLGIRKLLVTISAEDENKSVKLFSK